MSRHTLCWHQQWRSCLRDWCRLWLLPREPAVQIVAFKQTFPWKPDCWKSHRVQLLVVFKFAIICTMGGHSPKLQDMLCHFLKLKKIKIIRSKTSSPRKIAAKNVCPTHFEVTLLSKAKSCQPAAGIWIQYSVLKISSTWSLGGFLSAIKWNSFADRNVQA